MRHKFFFIILLYMPCMHSASTQAMKPHAQDVLLMSYIPRRLRIKTFVGSSQALLAGVSRTLFAINNVPDAVPLEMKKLQGNNPAAMCVCAVCGRVCHVRGYGSCNGTHNQKSQK